MNNSRTENFNPILDDDVAKTNLLSAARQEMYTALDIFHAHIRHLLSLMFAVMTAIFAVFGLIFKSDWVEPNTLELIRVLGGSVLVLLFPLGVISILILSQYYKLYVAAIVYAADLHEAIGWPSHLYFEEIRDLRESLGANVKLKQLVRKRAYGWRTSWFLYSLLILIISIAGLVIGILLILQKG